MTSWSMDGLCQKASAMASCTESAGLCNNAMPDASAFTAYGFEGLGSVVYAHYVLGGKLKKTVRIGALSGDCGNLRKRMKQFPFRPVPAGDWRVDFDTSRAYSGRADAIRYAHVKVPASKAVR